MRHNYLTLIYLLVATLMAGGLQSCDDDYFNGGNGTKVTITATTAFSNTTSRAVYEDDTYFEADDIEITNYCFLLFDGNGDLKTSFNIPQNALPYVVELERPKVGENSYSAFLLGNVTKETLSAVTKIADLKNYTFEIARTYNLPKDSEKNLFTWSGYQKVNSTTNSLDFILNPNVAKITATITNNSTESVIKSVRVKNVLRKVCYAQNALNEYSPELYVTNVSEPSFIKYDIETFETPIEYRKSETISWYVPQNIQGEGVRKSTDDALANESGLDGEDDKDGNLPLNATYVEIDGVKTSNNVTVSYRVYPGIKKGSESYAEMTNFDVKADVIYNLDVTINNDGIDDKSDVTTGYKPNSGSTATAKIKLPENSNCYMIHPIGDRIANVTVYELPISRINQYWTTVAGEDGTADSHHALTADSKWQVEVIWQDIADKRAITFCDEYGNTLPDDEATGEGLNPFCFKLENNSTDPGSQTYGNVLVGIKKLKSDGTPLDGYCWSWHLWITDYNPDKAPAYDGTSNQIWSNDVGVYASEIVSMESKSFTSTDNAVLEYERVNWSNVQHYNSLWRWYWKDNPKSAAVWDGNGIYAKKWIMDRNLGALRCNVGNPDEDHLLDSWGMYYQYGRKDPFSYKIVYDITGKVKKYPGSTEGDQYTHQNKQASSFSEAVMNPNDYYAVITDGKDKSTKNWIGGSPVESKWYSPKDDPMKPDLDRCQKTLFDPCPPGWCVPSVDAFDFASYTFDHIGGTYPKDYYTYNGLSYYTIGASNKKPVETDCYYAKFYAHELDLKWKEYPSPYNPYDKYAHTAVTVHVDAKGPHTDPDDYSGIDDQYSTYNSSITGYGDRERMYATLYSTSTYEDGFKALEAVFPMQGRISGDGPTAGKLGSMKNLKSYTNAYVYGEGDTKGYLPNYHCADEQGCLWTLENGGDNRQATLILFQPTLLFNSINARQEVSRNRLFLRFHGYMRTANWCKARGQNVRCIQEPD